MPYALGARSLGFSTRVDRRTITVAQGALVISAQDAGFDEEQSRTEAEEAAKVAAGLSHTLKSHHIIDINPDWAAAGCSGAVDLVPWNGSVFVWEWPRCFVVAAAMRLSSISHGIPITWGGCWDRLLSEIPGDGPDAMKSANDNYIARHRALGNARSFVDGPHFHYGRN